MDIVEKITDNLIKVAENELQVYDAGYSAGVIDGHEQGFAEGETAGIEAGKQTEHDNFWERYQRKGSTDYATKSGVFNGFFFGFSNFYPKYDIRPVGAATHLFYAWENSSGDSGGSLKQRLEECGVVLDTSQATNLQLAFAYTHITEIPTIDCTKCGSTTSGLFSHGYTRLRSIEKIIVNENNTFSSWFYNTAPKEIRFEGVIANNLDISYQHYSSKQARLSKASIENILEHLSDTVEGKTLTLSQTNIDNTNFGSYELASINAPDGTSREFYSNPLFLQAGQKLKVKWETEAGHHYNEAAPDAWKVGFMGFGGAPFYNNEEIFEIDEYYASDDARLTWYVENHTGATVENIPLKITLTVYNADGTEVADYEFTGMQELNIQYGGNDIDLTRTTVNITWDSLIASKPNWTFSLV